MSYKYLSATHFWEYQITNTDNGAIKWERYDPSIQAHIFGALRKNSQLLTLKIEDTHFEILFDRENGNHRQRDVNIGSECVVRQTPEVIVKDWSTLKKMTDVDIIKVTKLDLSGAFKTPRINDHDAHELTMRLANCKSLWYLRLYENELTDAFGVIFGKSLATNNFLRVVDLGFNKFVEETGVEIGAALTTNTSLHTLYLYDNNIKERGGAAVIRGLKTNTTLKILGMGRNALGADFGVDFGVAIQNELANNMTLYDLQISSNDLCDQSGVAIAAWLATNKTLKRLSLHDNNLASASGVAFGKALATNTSLKELNLDNNKMDDASGVAFAKGLAINTSLRVLTLGETNLGIESGVAFGEALATNTSLIDLTLGGNQLGSGTSRVVFANALAINTSLRELDLANTNLGLGGDGFGAALAINTSLRILKLSSNKLGDISGVAFGKALVTNRSLRHLDLSHNALGEKSGVALVDGLSQNSTLTTLFISGNDTVNPATRAKIKFALSPELKGLLNTPSVSPSRIPVCVVGFDNVGKTELVNTWHRTTAHEKPHLDPEETAVAKSDNERDKTSGISIKPITLKCNRQGEVEGYTVKIMVWDFAGHGEYFVSHQVLASGCRHAIFVLLFRIDRLLHPETRKAEVERLFFWLRFVATMRSVQQQHQLPTVLIGGSFRPSNNDGVDLTEWVLREAKQVFGSRLNIPQQNVYLMDCRKCSDPHVVALRETLAEAAETIRTREVNRIPPICETARSVLADAKKDVTSKLDSYEEHSRTCQSNPNASVTPLSWLETMCGPIMTRADFEEHVLGKLEVKAEVIGLNVDGDHRDDRDDIHYNDDNDDALFDDARELNYTVPTIAPKSKQLFQVITTYLHDVGDILWFDVDGLRDTVILTPDLFCSKIIGAMFRPDAPGFGIDAMHGGGALVPKSTIVTAFKRALGIDGTHVDAALAILCQLGLCHGHQGDDGRESYLFPGALAATSYRRPEWFGPLPPGRHFVVGRRFTLANSATTIFAPGCMSEIQVWALGRYQKSTIWRDGGVIPYTATQTLAEAGVQLHRPHSSSQDGGNCAQVSVSSITLVVRGSDAAAKPDCLLLLNELCQKIRETSGTQLVEEALPPNEVAKSSTNDSNMLDVTCPGFAIPSNLDPSVRGVVVGGKSCTVDSLRFGSFVNIPHPVQSTPIPKSWLGKDFEPVCAQTPNGGAHLLVEIPRDHADFTRIETNMHRSMPNAAIGKIQRVQNRALWNKYFPARSDIANECEDGSPNEIEGWHSTGSTDPWLICRDWKAGFDVNRSVITMQFGHDNVGRQIRDFHNFDNKSYGTGVYLAEHCIYPDAMLPHIRPNSQDRQIILAKVTLGNSLDYDSSIPAFRSAIEPEGFHSISGTEGDMEFLLAEKQKLIEGHNWSSALQELVVNGAEYGRQYVVHRSNQVYPAYLVTYAN